MIEVKNNRIVRAKVRPPTLAYLWVLKDIMPGLNIADVPVVVSSLDPCLSCCERILVVDNKKSSIMSGEELKKWKK